MKAKLVDAVAWTPERGALSADDGLGALCRFARACAAVSEWMLVPDANTPVVIGTRSGAKLAPPIVEAQLVDRWPGARVSFVSGGLETVPLSLLEALLSLRKSRRVLWVVAELQPGAELVGAFLLERGEGAGLSLERLPEPTATLAAHLNPCAPVLALQSKESVSIRVGSWLLTRAHDH